MAEGPGTQTEREPRRVGEALIIEGRVEKLEREQVEARQREEEHKKEQAQLNRRMVRFTGYLVLCAILAGGISVYQAYVADRSAKAAENAAKTAEQSVMEAGRQFEITQAQHEKSFRHTAEHMRQQTELQRVNTETQQRQAKAAEASVKAIADAAAAQVRAAEKNVEALRWQIHQEQRPWITLSIEPRTLADLRNGKWPVATLRNTGKMPALQVQGHLRLEIVHRYSAAEMRYDGILHRTFSTGSIAPGDERKMEMFNPSQAGYPVPLTTLEIEALESGQAYVVAYIDVLYRDAEDSDLGHLSRACSWKPFVDGSYPSRNCTEYNVAR